VARVAVVNPAHDKLTVAAERFRNFARAHPSRRAKLAVCVKQSCCVPVLLALMAVPVPPGAAVMRRQWLRCHIQARTLDPAHTSSNSPVNPQQTWPITTTLRKITGYRHSHSTSATQPLIHFFAAASMVFLMDKRAMSLPPKGSGCNPAST
jgi:hypothetical protein